MSSNLEAKKEHTFIWRIEDLRLCTKVKNERLESPVFRAKSLYDTSWFVEFYPNGEEDSEEGYMSCYIVRSEIDNGDIEIQCEYKISIIGSDGKILQSDTSSDIFRKGQGWGWNSFWKKSLQSLGTKEDLLIQCNLQSNAQKFPSRSESSGVTSIYSDYYSFKWIVKNLNSKCSEVIKFPCTGTSQIQISVEVLDDDIKITIRRVDKGTGSLSIDCRITLLDVKGEKHDSRQFLHLFETKKLSIESDSLQFPTFLKKSKLNSDKEKYLDDDSFTLLCKIAISNGTQVDSVEDKECDSSAVDLSSPDMGAVTILEDMKKLYNDKIHADVKLYVDGQTIQAHKNILSIRSPVFLAMFDADMVENEEGSVTITDLAADTVNYLLEYMYTGTVGKLDYEIAAKLIVAAEKYQVLPLKEKCALLLKSVLSHANVCEVLVIADLIHHKILRAATVNYIKDNSENIFLSEEWKSVAIKNLQLAADTIIQVSKLMAVDRMKTENK